MCSLDETGGHYAIYVMYPQDRMCAVLDSLWYGSNKFSNFEKAMQM